MSDDALQPGVAVPPLGVEPPPSRAVPLVLVVEDNDDNRNVVTTMLRYVGYDVAEAVDGLAAVELARQLRPDLILMDVSLPQLDGWAATRRIKADPDTRPIIVVAVTAHALGDDFDRSMAAGCDGYVAKPVEPRRLMKEVARHLAARPAR